MGEMHFVVVYDAAVMLCSDQAYGDVHMDVFGHFQKDMEFNFAKGAGAAYPTSWWIAEEAVQRVYFGSCSPKDVQFGMLCLQPAPCLSDDATTFTAKGYHSVPRVYIKTTLDTCLQPKFQDLFILKNLPKEVLIIESGHAAFLSASMDLYQHLLQIAGMYAR